MFFVRFGKSTGELRQIEMRAAALHVAYCTAFSALALLAGYVAGTSMDRDKCHTFVLSFGLVGIVLLVVEIIRCIVRDDGSSTTLTLRACCSIGLLGYFFALVCSEPFLHLHTSWDFARAVALLTPIVMALVWCACRKGWLPAAGAAAFLGSSVAILAYNSHHINIAIGFFHGRYD